MNPEKPSTSKQYNLSNNKSTEDEDFETEVINPNNKKINETLDAFAKTYNLTAQNHVVKNPQTFSTLIRKDPEAIANLCMTRSRQKELERISNVKLDIELKPVNAPRTFLDVDYGDDDEDDADYKPEFNEDDENLDNAELDQDDDESDFPTELNADWGELITKNDMPQELLTSVDDPDYLYFLKSVATPTADIMEEDDLDDDEEFNLLSQDLDIFEAEEFRMDRTTKIPRWELDALRQDWVFNPNLPVNNSKKQSTSNQVNHETLSNSQNNKISNDMEKKIQPTETTKCNQVDVNFTPVTSIVNNDLITSSDLTENLSKQGDCYKKNVSCSLLASKIKFEAEELNIIKIQLEKHVQLLTQCIIGTHENQKFIKFYNEALKMIHELDSAMYSRQNSSLFNIENLSDAVYTCHEISACQSVELPLKISSSHGLFQKNKVIWVLSKSRALKYPQLLNDVLSTGFETFENYRPIFLPSEQVLLALALYELFHVKHSSCANNNGKYAMISSHFLPTKTVTQIRNHLRNIRTSFATPLHYIVSEAYKDGVLNANFVLDSVGRNRQLHIPLNWPKLLQPLWLQEVSRLFNEGVIQILPEKSYNSIIVEANSDININIIENMNNEMNAENMDKINNELNMDNMNNVNNEINLDNMDHMVNEINIHNIDNFNNKMDLDSTNNTNSKTKFMIIDDSNIETKQILTNQLKNENLLDTKNLQKKNSSEKLTIDEPYICNVSEETSNDVLELINENNNNQNNYELKGSTNEMANLKSRRKIRVAKGLERLFNFKAREDIYKAVAEAVYEDIKKRLFMHQDKLKDLQKLIANDNLSINELFKELAQKFQGEQDTHVLALLASLIPDDEFLQTASILNDSKREAYKIAIDMIVNIYTYLSASKSVNSIRHVFKSIKKVIESSGSDVEIIDRLKHHFGSRDDPLWKLLRKHIPYEKFDEKVKDWQYESIEINDILQCLMSNNDEKFQFETIDLSYKSDLTERGQLRLKHGRLTIEHNGRIKTVNVGFTTNQNYEGSYLSTSTPWTRDDDRFLLTSFQNNKNDSQKTIDEYLLLTEKKVGALEISRRLTFLINMLKKIQSN